MHRIKSFEILANKPLPQEDLDCATDNFLKALCTKKVLVFMGQK